MPRDVVTSHINSEGEYTAIERIVGGEFDGRYALVIYDDPPGRTAAPTLLDEGMQSWLLGWLEPMSEFATTPEDPAEETS